MKIINKVVDIILVLIYCLSIPVIFCFFIWGLLDMSEDNKNNRVLKKYKVEVFYKEGGSEVLESNIVGDKRSDINFKLKRDFGSECLYVKDGYGITSGKWKKITCGVRRYKIINN